MKRNITIALLSGFIILLAITVVAYLHLLDTKAPQPQTKMLHVHYPIDMQKYHVKIGGFENSHYANFNGYRQAVVDNPVYFVDLMSFKNVIESGTYDVYLDDRITIDEDSLKFYYFAESISDKVVYQYTFTVTAEKACGGNLCGFYKAKTADIRGPVILVGTKWIPDKSFRAFFGILLLIEVLLAYIVISIQIRFTE